MRNAINKDFFREIKYTLNRYVSILLIVALGVAFLAGIRATCPDMKLTLDHYLDEADYMDLRVLSTLGLTGEDLTAIAEENAAGTEETSASAAEVGNTMTQMADEAKHLSDIANKMEENVIVFVVDET